MTKKFLLMFSSDFNRMSLELQNQLYRKYYNLVYDMVFYIIKDHASTEDIIQDSFLKALRKPPRVLDPQKINNWLKTLTRNTALNYLRKHKRHLGELRSSEDWIEVPFTSNHWVPSVEQLVDQSFLKEQIVNAISQLNPGYRHILILKYIYDMTYKEIAKVLNITEAAVRQRLARARKAASKILLKSGVTTNEERAIR